MPPPERTQLFSQERAQLFCDEAVQRLNTATKLTPYLVSTLFKPYHSGKDHALACVYPFFHVAHLVRNVFQLGECVMLFFQGLFSSEPADIAIAIVEAFANVLGALFMNTINLLLSVISLLTRSVATLFNLGYTKINPPKDQTNNNVKLEDDADILDDLDIPINIDPKIQLQNKCNSDVDEHIYNYSAVFTI